MSEVRTYIVKGHGSGPEFPDFEEKVRAYSAEDAEYQVARTIGDGMIYSVGPAESTHAASSIDVGPDIPGGGAT